MNVDLDRQAEGRVGWARRSPKMEKDGDCTEVRVAQPEKMYQPFGQQAMGKQENQVILFLDYKLMQTHCSTKANVSKEEN